MRLIILCVLSLILCGICLSEEYQIENTPYYIVKNETKLTDLNTDVLFLICTNLQLADLIHLSKTNHRIASSAASAFRHTYRNYTIKLIKPMFDRVHSISPIVEKSFERIFEIFGLETYVAILENFGHVIFGLNVLNENLNAYQCADMSRLINKYCSESLVDLNFNAITFNTLQHFTVPFNKIDRLTLSVGSRPFNASILPLNQLFPNLRELDFHFCNNVSYTFIDYTFANLEHLSLLDFSNTYKPKSAMEELMKKNSHIKSIKLNGYPGDYVRVIQRLVPNIERLELHYVDVGAETFQLEHLKHLHVHKSNLVGYEKLSFPRLESLILSNPSRHFDEWIEFCRNHSNLSRLHVTENLPYISKDLVKLTEKLPNLIELKIEIDSVIKLETIDGLIESHEKLIKMELSGLFTIAMDVLRKRYGNEWIIQGGTDLWTSKISMLSRLNAE